MENANDHDRLIGDAIEGEIVSRHQMPDAWSDIVAGDAGIGETGKLLPPTLYSVEDAVRGGRIVLRDLQPDRDKIFVGLAGATNRRRQNQSRRGSDAARRR